MGFGKDNGVGFPGEQELRSALKILGGLDGDILIGLEAGLGSEEAKNHFGHAAFERNQHRLAAQVFSTRDRQGG